MTVQNAAVSLITALTALLSVGGVARAQAQTPNPYAASVTAYAAGTGVAAKYTNPNAALGEPSRVTPGDFGGPVDPFSAPYLETQLVGLGTGGSLTLHFDTPIRNDAAHPFGMDFQVYGSSFFVVTNGFDANFNYIGTPSTDGSVFGDGAAQTRVSVSADGVTFFTLNPALAPQIKTLFPTDGSGDFGKPVNPALKSANFAGMTLDGIRALYSGSGGGAGFDLAWAQDSGGHAVAVDQASFLRIDVVQGKAEIDGVSLIRPFSAVPEPGVWALAALGLLLLVRVRRN